MSFGSESIFKVKARAMPESLFFAWDKGLSRVEIESENVLLVELLQSGGGHNSNLVEVCLL